MSFIGNYLPLTGYAGAVTLATGATFAIGGPSAMDSNIIAAVGKIGSFSSTGSSSPVLELNATNGAAYIETTAIGAGSGQNIVLRYNLATVIGTHYTNGDFNVGAGAALATSATGGFLLISSSAGAPTGVPTNYAAGRLPLHYDSTNNQIYVYNGAWKKTVALT